MFDELNVDITSNEIQKAISQLKKNRSGGPDGFLNEFFYSWRYRTITIST